MSDKILRVTVKVEEFEINSDNSSFERTDHEFQFSTNYSTTSIYEALIRGTDAALADFRGGQTK